MVHTIQFDEHLSLIKMVFIKLCLDTVSRNMNPNGQCGQAESYGHEVREFQLPRIQCSRQQSRIGLFKIEAQCHL